MMEHTLLRTVKIVHSQLNGGEYRLLADFFRIIGCFVSECTLEEEPQEKFDLTIVIGKLFHEENKEKIEKFPNQDRMIIIDLFEESMKEECIRKEQPCIKYLQDCLSKIPKCEGISLMDDELTNLNQLAGIYVENELMQSRCTASYMFDDKEIVQEAQKKYAEAFVKVKELSDKTKQRNSYVEFMRIDLARLLNETNSFRDERFLFDINKLLDYADHLHEKYPDFHNLYIYQGLLAELDRYTADQANEYYQKALEQIGGREYAVYANYRLGRYYERRRRNSEKALQYYKEANRLNRHSYRTLYKLGMYHRDHNEPSEAIRYFSLIITDLSYKKDNNYLQQKEYEYLYKAYCLLGNIYEKQEKYQDAIEQYEEAMKVIVMLDRDDNRWYREIFGTEAKKYLKSIKKRWPLNTVWECLMRIYLILGNQEKMQEYHDKLIQSGDGNG